MSVKQPWLGPLLQPLVRPGGVVVSDRRLVVEGWRPMDEGTTHPWDYFLWMVER